METILKDVLLRNRVNFCKVVDVDREKDNVIQFDFTENNKEINPALIADTENFSAWVNKKLEDANAKFAIGGYNENRVLYRRSNLFEGQQERSLHLGVDVWGAAGTKVHMPVGGIVHSFAFNDNFGDYGATIIMQHHIEMATFYTLYGHLSLADLQPMRTGKYFGRGEVIGHFGLPVENGNWPPHLHFQLIEDIGIKEGDYPGVCSLKEAEAYLKNCPNPNMMFNF
jgi:peptidoglycan LD-endopeptidase LytH